MTFLGWLFTTFGTLVIIASFIHLLRYEQWWIRIWDFPHLQLSLLSLIGCLAGLAGVRLEAPLGTVVTAGLGLAFLYQLWLILPYTPVFRAQLPGAERKDPTNTIRLLIANIYMDNRQYDRVLEMVAKVQPDVLLIVEADEAWRQALGSLKADYPFRVLHPLPNTYGMLLYSRLPIREHEIRFLIEDDIPSIRAVLELPSGIPVHFYGVHPQPPSPTEHDRSTERDAELLLIGREVRQLTGPVIVAGDLNDVAWSHTTRLFQRTSGLFDPRVGRGMFNSFHASYFFLRWPLDHVFVSQHFKLEAIRRLPRSGSDHFPIFAQFLYDPQEKPKKPQPEGDDQQEATEKIERGLQGTD